MRRSQQREDCPPRSTFQAVGRASGRPQGGSKLGRKGKASGLGSWAQGRWETGLKRGSLPVL